MDNKITTMELVDGVITVIAGRIKRSQDEYSKHASAITEEAGSSLSAIMNGDSIKRHVERMEDLSDRIVDNKQFLSMLKEIKQSLEEEA